MKIGLIYAGVLTTAAAFVMLYSYLVAPKTRGSGVIFGLLFGISTGASYACGGYAVHPIPGLLAVGWFVLCVIEAIAGGLIVGALVRERPQATA